MRWDEAARVLQEAMATGTSRASDLNEAHILLGAMAYQQGNVEAAKKHFTEAYRCDPQKEPSPQLFPPQVVEFYRSVHAP
jgi:tetratricopeptide (TPR) repeat protein